MKLNEKINYYRKQAKLSQEELAALVGVSRQAVSKWELGDATPELDKLVALARTFGVTTDELLSEEEPQQPSQESQQPEADAARHEYSYDSSQAPPSEGHSMGFLERLARRYGWLAGVYVALSGLGLILVGALARFAFGRMFSFEMDLPAGWDWSGIAAGHSVTAATGINELFLGIATGIMVFGAVILLLGVVLAVWLYRRGRNAR